ncbi:hypothetical protein LXL04_037182 [Taraxacum kok-saghyz]
MVAPIFFEFTGNNGYVVEVLEFAERNGSPNSDLYKRNKALIAELSVPRPGTNDLFFPNTVFAALLCSIHGLSTRRDLVNAMGSMYAATLFLGVQNALAVQPVVDVERTVFYRERAAGIYSALPYAFAQVLVEIPYVFSQSGVYSLVVYAMIGFEWTAAKFFWYFFFEFCCLLYMTYYGMMTVAITPNANIAAIIASSFFALFNLFSGFIIPRPRIPVWWRWSFMERKNSNDMNRLFRVGVPENASYVEGENAVLPLRTPRRPLRFLPRVLRRFLHNGEERLSFSFLLFLFFFLPNGYSLNG